MSSQPTLARVPAYYAHRICYVDNSSLILGHEIVIFIDPTLYLCILTNEKGVPGVGAPFSFYISIVRGLYLLPVAFIRSSSERTAMRSVFFPVKLSRIAPPTISDICIALTY